MPGLWIYCSCGSHFIFTNCLIVIMCRKAKRIKVYIHLIIFLLIHSKLCVLDFILPTQAWYVCRSGPHNQKSWTDPLWYRRRRIVIPLDIFPTRWNITQFIYFWKPALHVSVGIFTHHQEHIQLYLQYLVLANCKGQE